VVGKGREFFRETCQVGLEGILSKRVRSLYRPGRTTDWVKVKCTRRQEFVIGAWRSSTASTGG
jgi:bifunctional non-homologous end joining protein LigD